MSGNAKIWQRTSLVLGAGFTAGEKKPPPEEEGVFWSMPPGEARPGEKKILLKEKKSLHYDALPPLREESIATKKGRTCGGKSPRRGASTSKNLIGGTEGDPSVKRWEGDGANLEEGERTI